MRMLFLLFFLPTLTSTVVVALFGYAAGNDHPILVAVAGFVFALIPLSLIAQALPGLVEDAVRVSPAAKEHSRCLGTVESTTTPKTS